jgi:hypothetical protein
VWQVYEVNRNLLWLQSDWQEAALKSVHFTTLPLLIAANLAMADLLSGSDFSIQQRVAKKSVFALTLAVLSTGRAMVHRCLTAYKAC